MRYGQLVRDRTLFASDVVRYEGELVAAVATTSIETAGEALSLIEVEYEDLDPVTDPRAAVADARRSSIESVNRTLRRTTQSETATFVRMRTP